MKTWKLGIDGYVMQYMISGPVVEPFTSQETARDQLEIEKILRRQISTKKPEQLSDYFNKQKKATDSSAQANAEIKLGAASALGKPWCVYAPHNSCFIDVSDFYLTLQTVHFDAVTELIVPDDITVRARVWSYMSVGIYLGGSKVGDINYPVYKPMESVDIVLNLKKGSNQVYFVCDNLGARDTRNILGMQILEDEATRDMISVKLSDDSAQDEAFEAEQFIADTKLVDDSVVFPHTADDSVTLEIINRSPDYYRDRNIHTIPVSGKDSVEVSRDITTLKLTVSKSAFSLSRTLEFALHTAKRENSKEFLSAPEATERNLIRMYQDIASVKSLDRGSFGFGIMSILARRYLAQLEAKKTGLKAELTKEDRQLLIDDIDCIERRVDCADFLICGFIRYVNNYDMDDELKDRLKKALLDFRYWMDEEGSDAMCFWSENHSLMFYSCAMFIGDMYPDEYFTRARRTGRELSQYGKAKVLDWLTDVEQYGFEEFLSNVYMSVTLAALLNLVDYGDCGISERATKICDTLVRTLCLQCYQKTVVAPMGRVYREALFPFAANTQTLINAIDPEAPFSFGEGWMAYLATSRYKFPEDCRGLMEESVDKEYTTGNALIHVKKNSDYILTSVASPRTDGWTRWKNIRLLSGDAASDVNPDSHEYNKALNESFHGTSLFTPGTHGYQQQMWVAALDSAAILFVNHPGTTSEQSGMRPGYWNGNGIMPALSQKSNELLCVYSIPEKDPIHFVHAYCPLDRYDETLHIKDLGADKNGEWLFLRKGKSYMAFWSSTAMEAWDEQLFRCEFRMMGRDTGCYVRMGSEAENGDFMSFCKTAMEAAPDYDGETKTLTTRQGMSLKYIDGDDKTQFIY